MRNIRLFTLLWGDRYVDWFERACVASLCWPRNGEMLRCRAVGWDIVTRQEDAERVQHIAEDLGIPVDVRIVTEFNKPVGNLLQQYLIDQMKRSLERDEAMLLCPPDTIYGDGSVANIIAQGDVCVAVPHVRAIPNILNEISGPVGNADLVALSWKHLHRSWREADISKEMANSNVGGVSWRELDTGLYAVQHRLPTCYLANFWPGDVEWFASQVFVGAWDHLWPAKLVAEERQRVICSSDAAFLVELTMEFENISVVAPVDPRDPDKYWGKQAHHWANRNIVAIFRAAGAP